MRADRVANVIGRQSKWNTRHLSPSSLLRTPPHFDLHQIPFRPWQVRIEAEVEVVEMADEDLAPYTYDYTMRVEEAQAHLEGLVQRKQGDKSGVLEKSGLLAGSFTRKPEAYLKLDRAENGLEMLQGGVTPRRGSMKAKSGPLPRAFPPVRGRSRLL
jgi:hypothetical protein